MTSIPLPSVKNLLRDPGSQADATVTLTYDQRLLRRKRLVTDAGEGFMVDLPAVTNLDPYWGLELDDGRCVRIVAADEPVLCITGDLPRLAWHIGNRHTPCQITPEGLIIRDDHVLAAMLAVLGAQVTRDNRPFTPESGAYGTGRTMGHDHGPRDTHAHGHAHDHGHAPHDHAHPA